MWELNKENHSVKLREQEEGMSWMRREREIRVGHGKQIQSKYILS